jgi:hypothetical protein
MPAIHDDAAKFAPESGRTHRFPIAIAAPKCFVLIVMFSHAAARVLATLRAHCDRLEVELRELDADVESARAMVVRHGEPLNEPRMYLERMRAAKAAKLHETEQSLFALASSYDRGAALLTEMHPAMEKRNTGPWSTLKAAGPGDRVAVVTTSSPILQFARTPHGGRSYRS